MALNTKLAIMAMVALAWRSDFSTASAAEKSFDPAKFGSLQQCIDAASRWGADQNGIGVVSLTGTVYEIPKSLEVKSHVRLQGALTGARTTFHFTGPLCESEKDVSSVIRIPAGGSMVTISQIDFTRVQPGKGGGGFGGIFLSDVAVSVQNPVSNVAVMHCKVTDYTALFHSANMVKWSSDIEIGHCEAVNNHAYFAHVIMTRGLKFHDNVIEQTNLGDKWLHAGAMFRGVQDSEFINNQLNAKGGGRAFNGLMFEAMPVVPQLGGSSGASNCNLIIRGNRIHRTKEEGIIIERSREAEQCCVGDVIAATASSLVRTPGQGYGSKGVKVWANDFWQDRTVVIVNGRGLGQVRQVVANTDSTLTIDRPWDILPDTTSVYSVMHHTDRVLVEDNIVTDTGKASIAPYMCCGTTIRGNRMSLCMNHEWDTATVEMMCAEVNGQFGDDDGVLWPNYNNVIENNTIDQQRSMVGIRVGNTNFSSQQSQFRTGISTYNIRIENNSVDMAGATNGPNPIVGGVSVFTGSVGIVVEAAYLSETRDVIVRGNHVKNAKFGIWIGSQFETPDPGNQGRVFSVHSVENQFVNCVQDVHLSQGVIVENELPMKNLALGATATASSFYDRSTLPQYACDGSVGNGGWSSSAAAGETPWLQIDLGSSQSLSRIEVITRQDFDQPETRKNFHVLGSNTPGFEKREVLGTQGDIPLSHASTWSVDLKGNSTYRYLRVSKTAPEYFFVSEVRAFASSTATKAR